MERYISLSSQFLRFLLENPAVAKLQKHKAATISGAALLAVAYAILKITIPPREIRHIPCANNLRLIKAYIAKSTMHVIARDISLPAAMQNEQGTYCRFDINGWTVHITDPKYAKVFLFKTGIFPKNDARASRAGTVFGRFIVGENILFTNGDIWRRHRKVANPAFHRSMPVELFGKMTQKLFTVMDNLGETVDISDLMQRWTLDIIGQAGFGFDFKSLTEQDNNQWVEKYNSIFKGMVDAKYLLLPVLDRKLLWMLPARRKIHQDVTDFFQMLEEIIANKRRALEQQAQANDSIKDNEKDLLTLMMEEGRDDKEGLSDEELRSNLCIFFLAGHDTTSNGLCSALYQLAIHQDIQDKARKEAIDILGDDPVDVLPTIEQTKSMNYINMVIKEALRINPPAVSMPPRRTAEACDLGGIYIPKGTKVSLDLFELHRNPRIWDNPEKFDPDRFLPGGEADQKTGDGMPWIPFSSGSRQCIGMNFSLAEQRVLLSMLLRKYTVSLPKDSMHRDYLVTRGQFAVASVVNLELIFKKRY